MYSFCLSCPSVTFALPHSGFVPREWQTAKGPLSLSFNSLNNLAPRYAMRDSFTIVEGVNSRSTRSSETDLLCIPTGHLIETGGMA